MDDSNFLDISDESLTEQELEDQHVRKLSNPYWEVDYLEDNILDVQW